MNSNSIVIAVQTALVWLSTEINFKIKAVEKKPDLLNC